VALAGPAALQSAHRSKGGSPKSLTESPPRGFSFFGPLAGVGNATVAWVPRGDIGWALRPIFVCGGGRLRVSSVLRERLIGLIEPLLAQLGYELVEVEHAAGRNHGVVRIFIDRAQNEDKSEDQREDRGEGQRADQREDQSAGQGAARREGPGAAPRQGVGIDDCARVSREVSALFDVEDPISTAYTLEVSSPGEDRVLRTRAHFDRFVGSRIFVELKVPRDGRRRYTGQLRSVADDGIALEVDRQNVEVRFAEIGKARLAP
jgi:ribosome maturation factor RimP